MIDHPLAIEFGLSPEQAAAATCVDRHVCVEAGAGSGKTRVLVARLSGLLEPDACTLDEVVAITFTRKAASEMRQRLREAFRERAQSPEASPERQSHWRDLIRRLESARINTIDGFCASLLREHAVRLGIDPDFTVLDESESLLLRDEVVRDELTRMLEAGHAGARRFAEEFGFNELVNSILALLQQARAVDTATRDYPMGDPDALYERRREQADTAASEMVDRFIQNAGLAGMCDYLDSLDGHCADASDTLEGYRANAAGAIRVLQDQPSPEAAAAALATLCRFRKNAGKKANWPGDVLEGLRDRLGALRDLAASITFPEVDAEVERRAAQLAVDLHTAYRDVSAAYRAAKRRLRAMDFADLLTETVNAVRSDAELRSRLRHTFKHILIDEFQDTDPIQFELVSLLRRTEDEPGAWIFIVGDVKQSIYRFRGAEVEVFDDAKDASDEAVLLNTNYRSDSAILDFVNAFYETSQRLTTPSRAYQALDAHRANGGQSSIEFLIPVEDEERTNAGEYRRREAELVAQRLLAMCTGGAQVFKEDAWKNASFGDAAILFRKHGPIQIYEQVLREHGVPFVIEQGRGYFDRQEIHDVVNLLKFIANPWDEIALVGFLRSPLASLSDNALVELTAGAPLAQAFYGAPALRDPEQHARLERARELVRECHAMRHAPVRDLLDHIFERTGFESAQLALHHAVQRASNARKLLDNAESISVARSPDLHTFIRFVSQVHAYDLVESEAPWVDYESGAVTLMTVHKSKGLEFPIVVLADSGRTMSKGRQGRPIVVDRRYGLACKVQDDDGSRAQPVVFDLARQEEDQRELAEEARVLYVAMTRAKDHLLIAGAPGCVKDSWLDWHDQAFGVVDEPDGAEVSVGAHTVRVTRTHAAATAAAADRPSVALDIDALVRQAAPLVLQPGAGESVGVDQLLDLLHPPFEADGSGRAPQEIDPLLRGRALHKFFEEWHAGPPDIEEILAAFDLTSGQFAVMRDYLKQSLERFERSALYPRYRECTGIATELPFMVALGDHVMNGVIDALLPDGTIVDYKTGKNTAGKLARYRHQLQLYAYALRVIDRDAVSGAALYFADAGDVVEVDVSPPAVEAVLAEAQRALAHPGRAG